MPDRREKERKSKYTADRRIPGAFEGETVTRRRFMTLSAHGAGAVAATAFALPALGFAAGSALFDRPKVRWQVVADIAEFELPDRPGIISDEAKATYVPKVITMVSGIGEIGKTTVYLRPADKRSLTNPDGLDPPDEKGFEDDFVAISTRCMHLGCPVRYVRASQRFICPCHGGVYDFEGKVDGGPPVRPLDRFYTRVRQGKVEIGARYSVNSELDRFPSYRDPGQDLDGIGQYLYPGRFSTPKQD